MLRGACGPAQQPAPASRCPLTHFGSYAAAPKGNVVTERASANSRVSARALQPKRTRQRAAR